ncbi:MAG TPA: DUF58 domain-containing protein [Kofleriaceae bacterium]|nr:DUF58 domain-containing protein [Kofleriaceae bacterium]
MLTAEIIAQVRRIQLVTGRQVADVLAGAYQSVFKGRGMEFDEVRPYVPGDDVRTIDWNVTARTGEPFVKRYVEERELTVMMLCDVSASLDFGSAQRSKREAAVELAALLAFSAIANEDKVGLLLFHGHAEAYIPPRKGGKHALRVVREVLARGRGEGGWIEPQPADVPARDWRRFLGLRRATRKAPGRAAPRRSTSIGHALEFCQRVLPRRTVLFLVSDFLDEAYLHTLRSANRRHDVVCVLVTDERELGFDDAGLITLQDAESGRTAVYDTRSPAFRREVAAAGEKRLAGLTANLRASKIDLIRIDATRPVVDPLLEFFRMRERRQRR